MVEMHIETFYRMIGIRPEDRRKLWLMSPVFFLCGISELLNYNGFMTLFNQRFGTEKLPYVYAAEAFLLPAEAWFMSWLTGRLSKPQLMRVMYAIMGGIVAVNAAILLGLRLAGADIALYYPILFLSSNFVVRQQTLLLWSLAVDLCPTQQAKRLMPTFVAAATLGGAAAGLLARLVSGPFGPDIVYALAPLFLLAGWVNYRKAIARYLVPLTLRGGGEEAADAAGLSSADYFRRSLRSPFLLCAIGLMTLMPALYFLMEYEYIHAVQAFFPNESEFGEFFGLVTMLLFIIAFLLQLVSGRLMSWLGASNMLVAIALVFAAAFAAAALSFGTPAALWAISVGYMFVYLLTYYFAEPSYQLFFKTLPLEQRDGFRYVVQGVSASAGILLGAGLQFLHSGGALGLAPLAAGGVLASLGLAGLAWYGRQLYLRELVRSVGALRQAGLELAASFDEFLHHPKSMPALQEMLRLPNDYAREIALEVIGRVRDRRYFPQLLELTADASPRVRAGALRAMTAEAADLPALAKIASVLEDPEPEVRAAGVRLLGKASQLGYRALYFLRLKLLDAHPLVMAEAVKAIRQLEGTASYEACDEVVAQALQAGGEPAVQFCRVVADLELSDFIPHVQALLDDPQPAVRAAAIECLGRMQAGDAVPSIARLLPMADPELMRASIQAFTQMGRSALPALWDCLEQAPPKTWQAAAAALSAGPDEAAVRDRLVPICLKRLDELEMERSFEAAYRGLGNADLAGLARERMHEIRASVFEGIWAVLSRLSDERVVDAIRRAVGDADEETRGNGLEMLAEGAGDRRLSQRLLQVIERWDDATPGMSPEEAEALVRRSGESPDVWWQEMAEETKRRREGSAVLEEQSVLGRLNKVVFLKQVPFFQDLRLEELGLIADIAGEQSLPEETYLLRRGETNSTMYVLVEGNVELSSVSSAGWEATIGVLGPGDVLGETSALDGSASTVTAQPLMGEVRVLALKGDDVSRLIRLYPEIGIGLLRASIARIRLLEEMLMRIDT